jgi:hypothetical protein
MKDLPAISDLKFWYKPESITHYLDF